jgi:hypothetical protein
VEGESLRTRLRRESRLSVQSAVRIGTDARAQQDDRLTGVGQIPETPPYMSLEQADEDPELDAA